MDNNLVQYLTFPYNYNEDVNLFYVPERNNHVELNHLPSNMAYTNNNGNYSDQYSLEENPRFQQDTMSGQQHNISYPGLDTAPYMQYYYPDTATNTLSHKISSPQHSPVVKRKVRRSRTKFTVDQLHTLEEAYAEHYYIPKIKRMQLAKSLELPDAQVKVWFQNRRCKTKKEKRQRLSSTDKNTPNGKQGYEYDSGIQNESSNSLTISEKSGLSTYLDI